MGGGDVSPQQAAVAYELGRLIAQRGWILLNGGRNDGVMDATAKGAHDAGGFVVCILHHDHREKASKYLDLGVLTGMGSARNNINVLSSDVVIACYGSVGTISEIALALKAKRPVIVLDWDLGTIFSQFIENKELTVVKTPHEVIDTAEKLFEPE